MSKRVRKRGKLENLCTICNTIILGCSYNFKAHLFSHNVVQARFSCDVCPKKFYRKHEYTAHVGKHRGVRSQRKYTCDHCDRSFALKNNLITHLIRVHHENLDSELGRFVCTVCKAGYCERRLLFKHIRGVHLNVQFTREPLHTKKSINETWIESVVSKQVVVSMTKVNSNVIVIKRLNTDAKVSECQASLVEYTPECVDQYAKGVCNYCNKEMCKKSLRTHIREVHMNIRKFKCKTCNETFSRRYQMTEHVCGQFKGKKKFRKEHVYDKHEKKPITKRVIRKKIKEQMVPKNEVKIESMSSSQPMDVHCWT